jgi:tetratricopeptide (TPR) repeat protein
MRSSIVAFCVVNAVAVGIALAVFTFPVRATNRIEGVVYNPSRQPVNDVQIELQNDVGSLLSTAKTRGGGRFSFVGITAGRFLIRAVPMGLGFLEETVSTEIVNYGRVNSSDTAYVDIFLRYDRRASEQLQNRPAEVVFAQEVPIEAKKLYESGVQNIEKNPSEAITNFLEATRISPIYFDALLALGRTYMFLKDYNAAYPCFLRAIDINPRSVSSYYNLGLSFYQLNQVPAGLAAAKAATLLAPGYVDAQTLYGIFLRLNQNYKDAEIVLLKANALAKSGDPEVHWQLALLYNKLNRNEDAAKELELYLKSNPSSADRKKTQELIAKLRGAKQS